MSCESNPNKLAKLVGQAQSGISHLASKGSFYTGVAVGAAGTGMSLLVFAKLRQLKQKEATPTLIKIGPEGRTVEQTTTGRGRLATPKSARLGSRNNPLTLKMNPSNASGTRLNPRKLRMMEGANIPGAGSNPRKLNMERAGALGTRSSPKKLNMERIKSQTAPNNSLPLPVLSAKPPETKLEPTSIQVLTSSGQSFASKNSYRVVHPDGTNTGLCITPYVREDAQGQPVEDTAAWCVSHTGTGALISGPYDTVSKAHTLATQLSPLRWTRSNIPEADVEKAKQIISEYQQALMEKESHVL